MNALTVCQPYAHLIVIGAKPIENRTWWTNYRGEIAIHAGKSRDWLGDGDEQRYPDMAYGAIVGVARIVDCLNKPSRHAWRQTRWEHLYEHEHANGPICFVLQEPRRLATPILCRGAQGFWRVPDDVERTLREALRCGAVIDRFLAGESVESLAQANGVTPTVQGLVGSRQTSNTSSSRLTSGLSRM